MDGTNGDRGTSGVADIVNPLEDYDEFDAAFDVAGDDKETVSVNATDTNGTAADTSATADMGLDGQVGLDDETTDQTDDMGTAGTAGTVGDVNADNTDDLSNEEKAIKEALEKEQQRYKTLQGIHKRDKEAWEEERQELLANQKKFEDRLAEIEKGKTAKTEQEEDAMQKFIDSLTPEQKSQLAEYERDFETVSKMEGLKRQIELSKWRKELKEWQDNVLNNLSEQLVPMVERVEENDYNAHFSFLKERHPDYEQLRDDGYILTWIESKPSYMQSGLMAIYEEGSAADVADLITDCKMETGLIKDETVIPPVVDKTKSRKKQALTTVDSRKTAINPLHVVAEDYEGAFDEAAKA